MKRTWLAMSCGLALGLGITLTSPATALACYEDGCCKHCVKGKPCGDTCIARYLDCHQPPGCACGPK
jgi:hypothetical protein